MSVDDDKSLPLHRWRYMAEIATTSDSSLDTGEVVTTNLQPPKEIVTQSVPWQKIAQPEKIGPKRILEPETKKNEQVETEIKNVEIQQVIEPETKNNFQTETTPSEQKIQGYRVEVEQAPVNVVTYPSTYQQPVHLDRFNVQSRHPPVPVQGFPVHSNVQPTVQTNVYNKTKSKIPNSWASWIISTCC